MNCVCTSVIICVDVSSFFQFFLFLWKTTEKIWKKWWHFSADDDRCTHIIHIRIREHRYSSWDFLWLSSMSVNWHNCPYLFLKVCYIIRYLHFFLCQSKVQICHILHFSHHRCEKNLQNWIEWKALLFLNI